MDQTNQPKQKRFFLAKLSSLRVALILIHVIAIPIAIALTTFLIVAFNSNLNETELCRFLCFTIMQSNKNSSKVGYIQRTSLQKLHQYPLNWIVLQKKYDRHYFRKRIFEFPDYAVDYPDNLGIYFVQKNDNMNNTSRSKTKKKFKNRQGSRKKISDRLDKKLQNLDLFSHKKTKTPPDQTSTKKPTTIINVNYTTSTEKDLKNNSSS